MTTDTSDSQIFHDSAKREFCRADSIRRDHRKGRFEPKNMDKPLALSLNIFTGNPSKVQTYSRSHINWILFLLDVGKTDRRTKWTSEMFWSLLYLLILGGEMFECVYLVLWRQLRKFGVFLCIEKAWIYTEYNASPATITKGH